MSKRILKVDVKAEHQLIDCNYDSRMTNNKQRDSSQYDFDIMWPITPIKKLPKPEPLLLMTEELPEESDDEDYKPGPEDLQDQSEEETGPQSVLSSMSITSTIDMSASQYLAEFGSDLMVDESANQSTDYMFKAPEENIGQRTRSKLCLSDTPLEIIEKAFIPPDITTDMYDFKCDNKDWENFLKDFMQPLPNDTNDPDDDDEADPDYNVMAEEEEVDQEELRRDKAVKISRKELRKLMAELFESPDEYSSHEEEEKRVRTEITNRVNSDMREKAAKKTEIKEEEQSEDNESNKVIVITDLQKLLLQQHLRQHIQLTTQHFLQTCQHPVYGRFAKEFKVTLASLLELAKLNDKSILNVSNLKPAFSLIENWERYLLLKEGKDVIKHMKNEVVAQKRAKIQLNFHRITFHPSLMKLIIESEVFLYPLLLPPMGFRCDGPFKVEFVPSEDALIAIGLEQFSQYLLKFPQWLDKKKGIIKATVDLTCKYLTVAKEAFQVYRRIRCVNKIDGNPLNFYRRFKRPPPTIHYVIPLEGKMKKVPKDYTYFILPQIFQDYLQSDRSENKENNIG